MLVGVDQRIKRGAVDEAFFHEERFERLDTQSWIGRYKPW